MGLMEGLGMDPTAIKSLSGYGNSQGLQSRPSLGPLAFQVGPLVPSQTAESAFKLLHGKKIPACTDKG